MCVKEIAQRRERKMCAEGIDCLKTNSLEVRAKEYCERLAKIRGWKGLKVAVRDGPRAAERRQNQHFAVQMVA